MRLSVNSNIESRALEVEKREFNPSHISEEFVREQVSKFISKIVVMEKKMDTYLTENTHPEVIPFKFEGSDNDLLYRVNSDWENDPERHSRIYFNIPMIEKIARLGNDSENIMNAWDEIYIYGIFK